MAKKVLTPPQHPEGPGVALEVSGNRRVTAYDPDLALQVCELIAAGRTLKAITEDKETRPIAYSTFQRWVIDHPDLRKAYLAARELSAFAFEDEALRMAKELSEKKVTDSATVRAFDVAMNQLRWSASKRNPREYGDKGALNVTVPIQINTSLDLGQGGVPKSVEENIYDLKASVKIPTAELIDPDPSDNPLVPKRHPGRPLGHQVIEGLPSAKTMAANRKAAAEKLRIEETRRENAVEVR